MDETTNNFINTAKQICLRSYDKKNSDQQVLMMNNISNFITYNRPQLLTISDTNQDVNENLNTKYLDYIKGLEKYWLCQNDQGSTLDKVVIDLGPEEKQLGSV